MYDRGRVRFGVSALSDIDVRIGERHCEGVAGWAYQHWRFEK